MKLPNFVNPSGSKFFFYKKCAPKRVFFNEKKKDSNDSWHRQFTLKVRFWHLLMTSQWMDSQNTVVSFNYSWFLAKNLAF